MTIATVETAAAMIGTGAETGVETATMIETATDAMTTGTDGIGTVMIDVTTATAMTAKMIAKNQHHTMHSFRCLPTHAAVQSVMTETAGIATMTAITIAGETEMLADLDSKTGRSKL